MTDQSYIGKFNLSSTNNYAGNVYYEENALGIAPTPPTECYFILQEDGTFIELEGDLGFIEMECTNAPVNSFYILQEDGFSILQEDGGYILLEQGEIPMISFSLTLTGPWATNQTVTAQYQSDGNFTTVYIPAVSVAATSASLITSTASLPAAIVPTSGAGTAYQSGMPVISNSVASDGAATVATSTGILTIGLNVVGVGESNLLQVFQNAGNAGFENLVFTYRSS